MKLRVLLLEVSTSMLIAYLWDMRVVAWYILKPCNYLDNRRQRVEVVVGEEYLLPFRQSFDDGFKVRWVTRATKQV